MWHYWPEALMFYNEHCHSDEHQLVMRVMDRSMSETLSYFEKNWDQIRTDNKLWQRPEMAALSRLLR